MSRTQYASSHSRATPGGHSASSPSINGPRPRSEPTVPLSTGPHAAVQNLKLKLAEGHTGTLKAASWNSTGSRVASASTDRSVRVWYPERLPEPRSRTRGVSGYTWELKGHTASVESISWDPTHSDRIASASQDKTVKVWEYRMLRQLFSLELGSPVLHVVYSPDGRYLATGTKDERISIIDIAQQKVVKQWQETKTSINEIVWNHAGTLLCLSTQQGTVKIFDCENWSFLHEIEGNTSSVFCLEFDPTGRYLAVGGADAIISLWSLSDWICVRTFTALTHPIRSISFSYDGMYIAAGSEDNFVDISLVETGEQVHTIPVTSATNSVAWHPNRLALAIAGEEKSLKLYL